MKLKHGITLLAIGFCLEFVGGLMRILHYPHAVNILMIATIIKITALVFITFKMLSHPQLKELLNR